jgi:hypothetical protein
MISTFWRKMDEHGSFDLFNLPLFFSPWRICGVSGVLNPDRQVEENGTIMTEPEFHGQYLPMGVQPSMEKKRKAEEDIVELAPEASWI